MSTPNETTFFVASICGTRFEPLSRSEILHRLTARRLCWSQQVWCPDDQRWKQAREIKRLARDTLPLPNPQVVIRSASVVGRIPRLQQTPVENASRGDWRKRIKVFVENGLALLESILKPSWSWRSCIYYGVGCLVFIGALMAMNWFAAEKPVQEILAMTKFVDQAKIDAHFRFFIQPNALVIQISKLPQGFSSEEFINLLTDIASKTATFPILKKTYHSVTLAKGKETKFVFRGEAWKELAAMHEKSPRDRAMFLIDHLYLSEGQAALDQKEDRMEYLYFQKEQALLNFLETFLDVEKKSSSSLELPQI